MSDYTNYYTNSIAEQAQKALVILNGQGYEAWLVGGCVRDLLMGAVPKDWDIATDARPEEVQNVFADFKTIETGLKHGTLTALIDGMPVEITTYRVDGEYLDNRRPSSVIFTRSLSDDLARRDFTINAIAMDAMGAIKDYFGGQDDIRAKKVKCVGNPGERFREDGLRILRALRFTSILGFSIEDDTGKALHDNKGLLGNISGERVQAELTKLLCGRDVMRVLREYADIVGVVIPEILPMIGFDQRTPYHCYDVWEHTLVVIENTPVTPVMRWTALLHDVGKPPCFSIDEKGVGHFYRHQAASEKMANTIMKRLKFDNRNREMIRTLVCGHMDISAPRKKAVKKLMGKYGEDMLRMLIAFKRADNIGQAEVVKDRQLDLDECNRLIDDIVRNNECFKISDLVVDGNDMIELGFEGREIGGALDRLLEAVIEGEVENKREKLIWFAKQDRLDRQDYYR